MNVEVVEIIVLQVLGWLVLNDEFCLIFLGFSGVFVDDFKVQVGDFVFLVLVLEFVIMDD